MNSFLLILFFVYLNQELNLKLSQIRLFYFVLFFDTIICKAYNRKPHGINVFNSQIFTSERKNFRIKLCDDHSRDLFLLGENTFQRKFMKVCLYLKGMRHPAQDSNKDDFEDLLDEMDEMEDEQAELTKKQKKTKKTTKKKRSWK